MIHPKDDQSPHRSADDQLIHDLYAMYKPSEDDKTEVLRMMKEKKTPNRKKFAVAAAAALIIVTLPFTSFGEGIIETVKQVTTPTRGIVINEEKSNVDFSKKPLPNSLKGKIFDVHGNEIKDTQILREMGAIYTKDGKAIDSIGFDEKTNEAHIYLKEDLHDDYAVYKPIDQVAKRLTFTPLVLSDQYDYQYANVFAEGDEKIDTVALNYQTKDGKSIYIDERVNTPENAYETGGEEKVEERTIDGVKVIIQGSQLFCERDNLLVSISAKGSDRETLFAIYKDLAPLK